MHDDATTAITALILGYASAIDRGDLDALASSFEHATLRSPRGEAVGTEAVRQWYSSVRHYDDGTPQTHHHVFGIDIRTDADRADASSFVTVVQHGVPIIAGRYHDRFERIDGRWRFSERAIHLDLIGDLSGHLRRG